MDRDRCEMRSVGEQVVDAGRVGAFERVVRPGRCPGRARAGRGPSLSAVDQVRLDGVLDDGVPDFVDLPHVRVGLSMVHAIAPLGRRPAYCAGCPARSEPDNRYELFTCAWAGPCPGGARTRPWSQPRIAVVREADGVRWSAAFGATHGCRADMPDRAGRRTGALP